MKTFLHIILFFASVLVSNVAHAQAPTDELQKLKAEVASLKERVAKLEETLSAKIEKNSKSSTYKTISLEGFSDGKYAAEDNKARNSFFSFSTGEARKSGPLMAAYVKLKNNEAKCKNFFVAQYDIFFDGDHGLVANAEERGWELGFGKGGIAELGKCSLSDVDAVPKDSDFGPAVRTKDDRIKNGHTYCVRLADGKSFAWIHVVKYDSENSTIKLEWKQAKVEE
jgi:hypothetical protein